MGVTSLVRVRGFVRTAAATAVAASLLAAAFEVPASSALADPPNVPVAIDRSEVDNFAKFTEDNNTEISAHAKALIDAAPRGAQIRLPLYYFSQSKIVDALKKARARGVKVRIVINGSEIGMEHYEALTAAFEPRPGAAKIKLDVRTCGERVKDATGGFPKQSGRYISDRGCAANRKVGSNYSRMHNKFMTIDKVEVSGRGVARNVVYVASANLHEWTSYESVITVQDAGLYRFYSRYFDDMYRLATSHRRLDDYGSSHEYKPSGGKYQVYTFPRKEATGKAFSSASNDPVVADLKAAKCSTKTTNDVINVANVRIARIPVADALIAAGKRGCTVRVLTGDISYTDGSSERIYEAVNKLAYSSYIDGGVRFCGPVNNIAWMHEKFMQIGQGRSAGLYVGSHNLTPQALRQQDENILRLRNPRLYAAYTTRFNKLHDYCEQWKPKVPPPSGSGDDATEEVD
ncbi:phospholipase D-like domain-containing protein [Spirillospora sp. NPDC049652]